MTIRPRLALPAVALIALAAGACEREPIPARGAGAPGPQLQPDYPASYPAEGRVLPGRLIARGDSLYQGVTGTANCILCHGPFLTGGSHGTNLRDRMWHHADGSYASIVRVIVDGVSEPAHSPIAMPPLGGLPMTEEEVRAIAAYIYWFSREKEAEEDEPTHPHPDTASGPHSHEP